MVEYRIYVDGKLVNICQNEYVLMCNLTAYESKHGKEAVKVKKVHKPVMDEEKKEWLQSL